MSSERQMRAARANRGERSTPADEGDPQESSSKATYAQALELEQRLLTTIQSKGPFEANVRILRSDIREKFEAIILEDHEFAELHDVEQSLWRLHHTCIEEFRARMRRSGQPVGTTTPGNKATARREPSQKISPLFRSYLAEATGFYHDLILKIGAKHGLSQDDLTYNSVINKNVKKDDMRFAEIRRCQLSSHRCLIYLGDLARYKEYYGDGDGKNRDWSIAAGFYVKAASMWPASGNPYHQLAVLATYIGDEMLAVYHYFRSLASETPFLTAKDNLVVLFEKNRHSYLRLVALSSGNVSQTAKLERAGKGKAKGETQASQGIGDETSGLRHNDSQSSEQRALGTDFMRNFRVRFVRLNGILFTRTSLEAFPEVHSSVLSDLKELLLTTETDELVSSLTSGRNWGTGPNVLLQLISILIFSVHYISVGSGPETHQPTYAEILQRSVILAHAFIALFECIGHILQHCVTLDDPSNSLFLPAIVVVMDWLSCRPEITVGIEVKEKEGTARMFFWKNCVNFLNKFSTGEVGRLAADDINDRVTLWEDFELWGFTPLLPIQHKLDYVKKPDMGLGSSRERHARVIRLKHAAKVISDMFDGSDKGIHYDVERDIFYLSGEKKIHERKQVNVVSLADTLEAPPLRSVRDSKNFKQVAEAESPAANVTLPVEEEDEEPSRSLIPSSVNWQPQDGKVNSSLWSSDLHKLAPATGSFGVQGGSNLAMAKRFPLIDPSLGSLQSMGLASATQNLSDSASMPTHSLEPLALDAFAHIKPRLQDSMNVIADNNLGSFQFEPSRLSGSTVDWGGGASFTMQPSRNFIPASVNWQPQDGKGNSSLWSSELHKLASAAGSFGVQSGSNVAMAKRFPFMDPSLGSLQSMGLAGAAQNLSESASMPLHSLELLGLDALVQNKPRLQESINVIADNNFGTFQTFQATQDLNFLGTRSKLNPANPSDSEKPARRVAVLPSHMRPPPGFGPLPAKPPVSLSATTIFQGSQPASSAFSAANASLQQNTMVDQSGPLSGSLVSGDPECLVADDVDDRGTLWEEFK
ncbi:hypothetical protein GOP47_0022534 [Adiantum capillus-veneris]|uniref:Protein SMG7 n=1 Tax=Adiantum capillus-veneris TaxID=13818 RepID=A0A9D4U6G8_ADICA|nr:hypothetical protein GOP47_0022534 [Adiantum capillus-veneris]